MYLHDGIVDNPFNETERSVTSPLHRQWGVSVLWLPNNPQQAREGYMSAASGCGSERSTPELYTEPPGIYPEICTKLYRQDSVLRNQKFSH